jgi:chorismate dehydratase
MHKIGCVSFLNSKPLIEPLVQPGKGRPGVHVHFAVPSQLLGLLQSGQVSTALMSVVDYHHADVVLLPAGMIGCDGPTLTVRIYSRVPPQQIRIVHGDTDSHTSVILAQVILRHRFGVTAPLVPLKAREGEHFRGTDGPETMLLIGDKVVNASPEHAAYPHQLDLGEQWKLLTGLPFVFAMWMIRQDHVATEGQQIAHILAEARQQGAQMTETLLDRYAQEKSWPRELARKYFTQYLRYEVTPAARQGLAKFYELAHAQNLLPHQRPIEYLEIPAD